MLISGHLEGIRGINKLLKQALKLFKQNRSAQMMLAYALCERNASAHV
jgi:cytochrome c-type biogenesis protein CcmH/NrfG